MPRSDNRRPAIRVARTLADGSNVHCDRRRIGPVHTPIHGTTSKDDPAFRSAMDELHARCRGPAPRPGPVSKRSVLQGWRPAWKSAHGSRPPADPPGVPPRSRQLPVTAVQMGEERSSVSLPAQPSQGAAVLSREVEQQSWVPSAAHSVSQTARPSTPLPGRLRAVQGWPRVERS